MQMCFINIFMKETDIHFATALKFKSQLKLQMHENAPTKNYTQTPLSQIPTVLRFEVKVAILIDCIKNCHLNFHMEELCPTNTHSPRFPPFILPTKCPIRGQKYQFIQY